MTKNRNKKTTGVYVHIPFCVRKCNYCDFLSFAGDEAVKERYVDMVCSEIEAYCRDRSITADTVFIGGGTPSVLKPKLIERLMDAVRTGFSLTEDCEMTIEANPGTVDGEKAEVFKSSGINRISLGVQSMDDDLLRRLGRIHSRKDFLKTYELLRNKGFDNINTDLMFSLPGQNFEKWKNTLEETADLKPEHISFYSLIIEEGTPFYEEWKKGSLEEISDDDDRKMYHFASEMLNEKGYVHYEISNAALPGRESKHNLKYWSMEEYAGFGLGAHSFVEGVRYENTRDMEEYLKLYAKAPDLWEERYNVINRNTVKDNAEEFVFTGLRKLEGIYKDDFAKLVGNDIYDIYSKEINKMVNEGLLKDHGSRIALTKKGIDISNYVMREFIKDKWKL